LPLLASISPLIPLTLSLFFSRRLPSTHSQALVVKMPSLEQRGGNTVPNGKAIAMARFLHLKRPLCQQHGEMGFLFDRSKRRSERHLKSPGEKLKLSERGSFLYAASLHNNRYGILRGVIPLFV